MKGNVWAWCENWSEEWCNYFWFRTESESSYGSSDSGNDPLNPFWFGIEINAINLEQTFLNFNKKQDVSTPSLPEFIPDMNAMHTPA